MKTCLQAVGLALVALWMGCADFEQAEQEFCARNPDRCGDSSPYSKLAFTTAPQTVRVGACSGVTTVQLQDTGNSPVSVTADTAVALSAAPPEGFQFFAAADCTGTAVTSVTIRAGSSSASFYFKGTRAGTAMLNASTGSISGSQGVTLSAAPPAAIALVLPSSRVTAGTCTSASVQLKDASGFDTLAGGITPVSLQANPLGGIAFYSDAACTAPVGSVTVAAGEGSATFYFQGQLAEDVTITASSTGLVEDSKVAQILPGAGNRLAFTSPARTATAGACSAIVQFQSLDAQGNLAPVTTDTTVSLTASRSTDFEFYPNANCGGPAVTSITLPAGASSGGLYFKGTKSGSVTVTLTSPGFTGSSQAESVNPGPPNAIVLTTPQAVQAGVCSAAVMIELRDAYNNPTTATANTSVNLAQSGTPSDQNFRFYASATCGTAVTSITIPAGQPTANFYYRGELARTFTLTAATTALTSATQNGTIVPGNASTLAFSASSRPQTLLAGTCSGIRTVETRDAFGNLATTGATFNLSGSTTAEFFSDAGCTASLSQVTIPTGSSSASFYFKGFTGGINTTGSLRLTAAASGLASAAQTETIIPTVRTGSCSFVGSTTTCPILPALLDVRRAFLVFQATSRETRSDSANVRCYLDSPSQVRCERAANGGDVSVRWSVAEFPSSVAVQHQSVTCTSDTTSVPLSTIAMDRTFLLLSSQRGDFDMSSRVPRLAELRSPTEALIRKTGGCSSTDTNHLQAVEYQGASVQRGLASMPFGFTSTQDSLATRVELDRSILLYSYMFDSSGLEACDRALRGELSSDGTRVAFSRGLGNDVNCTNSSLPMISWEVVEFPVGTVVHQVTQFLPAGNLSVSASIPAVDLSRTIVIGGGQWASGQLHGEGTHSLELISEMRTQAWLRDNTVLEFHRETANDPARFTAYVVQLKP